MSSTPRAGSKYLTPCRTFGLKRKSSSPRIPSGSPVEVVEVRKKEKLDEAISARLTDLGKVGTPLRRLSIPLVRCDTPTTPVRVEGAPVRGSDTPVRGGRTVSDSGTPVRAGGLAGRAKPLSRHSLTLKTSPNNSEKENREQVTHQMLADLVLAINTKIDTVDRLKQTQVYTKKHDLVKLRESTERWKRGCREALEILLKESRERAGQTLEMEELLHQQNIPHDLVGFDPNTLQFHNG